MTIATTFRRALEDGDAARMCDLWRELYPHMPAPENIEQACIVMHRARTETISLSNNKRIYSHHWLVDQGFESGLPMELMPKAAQIDVIPLLAIGISVNTPPSRHGLGIEIHGEMSRVANEMLADRSVKDHLRIRAEMEHARVVVKKRLL